MSCKEIFTKIEDLHEAYVSVWTDIGNIESPTDNKAGVDAVGAYLARHATARGWRVKRLAQAVSGDVIDITMNPAAEGAPVVLSGHMDTVYPIGSFGTPAVRREGDRLCGPGVTDCKGGIVAGLLAMEALEQCGYRARPVRLLLQSDEETGSKGSDKATIRYICERAKDAVAFFNLERHAEGEACLARKGILTFTFTVHGKEAHASACATQGSNAILEAAHKIIEIERYKDDGGLTCCCSTVTGGTAVNTVAGECRFTVNVRFSTAAEEAWVKEEMQRIAADVHVEGCHTEVAITSHRVAMEYTERGAALLARVNEALSAAGLGTLRASRRKGGSDAADVTAYGIPCLDSLGVCGEHIHSPAEWADIGSLTVAAKRLACMIVGLDAPEA